MPLIDYESVATSVSEEDLSQYKNCVLSIMKDFHDFLMAHDIKYSLAFGTLLGAIRHNGFIPWDDDIDIILTNEEFHKLLKVIDAFNGDKYLVVKPLDDTYLAFPACIKIYDKRHSIKEYGSTHYNGPFIDVFSLIGVKSGKRLSLDLRRFNFYKAALMFKNKRFTKDNFLTTHPGVYSFLSHCVSREHAKKVVNKYYDRTALSGLSVSSYGSPYLYPREWFLTYSLHKFESCEFMVTDRFDDFLKLNFGDYMILPPIEKRNPHHLESIYFDETFLAKNGGQ
jgi:lipopolysaccharide cholinephosphotransferase